MDLKKYRQKLIGNEEERAVSPVIGVILMVAITVILAAAIAAFVLDMGNDMGGPETPNAVWESSQEAEGTNASDTTVITFTHESGDAVTSDDLRIAATVDDSANNLSIDADDVDYNIGSQELTAGDTVEIVVDTSSGNSDDIVLSEGDEVSLVWDDGDSSSTMNTHTVTSDITIE